MKYKFEKVKLSRHQQDHLENDNPGHDLAAAEADEIMHSPIKVDVQADGRERFWGYVRGKLYRVTVSATTTTTSRGVLGVERVVSGHRDSLPKK